MNPKPDRCYTKRELLALLKMSSTTFDRLKAAGELPYLEELRPRIRRQMRFRADLVDRYLRGEWGAPPRVFGGRRR